MLLSKSFDVIQSLVLKLVFDDESVKELIISEKDIINVVYNKNGNRCNIEGTVARINVDNNSCQKRGWYIIVDASAIGKSSVERIEVNNIINCDIITKYEANNNITSPIGDGTISAFKLAGDILLLSVDNGKSWLKVCNLASTDIIVEPEYQDIADKISAVIPSHMSPDMREDLVEDLVEVFKNNYNTITEDNEDPMTPEEGV